MVLFVRHVPPNLKDLLDKAKSETIRPGITQKEVNFFGITLRSRVMFCQDCGIEDPQISAPILTDDLWERIYPEDGLACGSCILKRLGRPLERKDLKKKARINYSWFTTLH